MLRHHKPLLLLASLLVASQAQAHSGSAHLASFAEGLAHPLSGLDHWVAMLMVGVWSALALRQRAWGPVVFVLGLALGAGLGRAALAWPGVELVIASSLLGLAVLVRWAQRVPQVLALGAMALFAVAHGWAHGVELAASSWLPGVLGMVCASAGLHLAGWALGGTLLQRAQRAIQAVSLASAALGVWLLTALA